MFNITWSPSNSFCSLCTALSAVSAVTSAELNLKLVKVNKCVGCPPARKVRTAKGMSRIKHGYQWLNTKLFYLCFSSLIWSSLSSSFSADLSPLTERVFILFPMKFNSSSRPLILSSHLLALSSALSLWCSDRTSFLTISSHFWSDSSAIFLASTTCFSNDSILSAVDSYLDSIACLKCVRLVYQCRPVFYQDLLY